MKYQVGQIIKFNSPHHKILQGKITKIDNNKIYGNYYVFEADATLHPEIEIRNIWICERHVIETVDNETISEPGSFCKICNIFNEYVNVNNYICYSCKN